MKTIIISLISMCSLIATAPAQRGYANIKTFEPAPLTTGKYTPWRNTNDSERWHAGEIITIDKSKFHYKYTTDCIDQENPPPNYTGEVHIHNEYILLSHPGISYPYRIPGKSDGIPVLLTWRGYQQWKKNKTVLELDILYLEQTSPSQQDA